MLKQNRRSNISTTSSTSSVKRPAIENATKVTAVHSQNSKKRVPLANIHHQGSFINQISTKTNPNACNKGLSACASSKGKKISTTRIECNTTQKADALVSLASKTTLITADKENSCTNIVAPSYIDPESCNRALSPDESNGGLVSPNESMSTISSIKSPEIEFIDCDSSVLASLERRTSNSLYISKDQDRRDHTLHGCVPIDIDSCTSIINVDDNIDDPQACATLACDIYKHLRVAETKKMPSSKYMEDVQKDINANMRAILIDWLVEVAEEYKLVPDTLYLTVNYIDRYLSGNAMERQQLQLLGVACMLIASKHEEICPPQVDEFCYITDNTYFKDEVLQMEATVLKYLKYEMTAPTAKCFLRRFIRAAQGCTEASPLQLEFLSNYIAELALLEYDYLRYPPSMVAAAAIFLAKFILLPSKRPWDGTLMHYTMYKPSDMYDCVYGLHRLFCNSHNSKLPAIREKYTQHKYKFVAEKCCPPSIPSKWFYDITSSSWDVVC